MIAIKNGSARVVRSPPRETTHERLDQVFRVLRNINDRLTRVETALAQIEQPAAPRKRTRKPITPTIG
jgi:hypothetical protein